MIHFMLRLTAKTDGTAINPIHNDKNTFQFDESSIHKKYTKASQKGGGYIRITMLYIVSSIYKMTCNRRM